MPLNILLKILHDPKTIVAAVLLGFASGFYLKDFSHSFKPIADIYVALLSMCLLPILVTALVWGIGQMLRDPNTRVLFGRLAGIYVIGLLVPCVVGIAVTLILQPGANLGDDVAAALGSGVASVQATESSGGLVKFLEGMIPPNVFTALSEGQFISIVFFCVLAGLGLGVVRSKGADETLRVVNALYETFITIFHWVLIPLPIGLFCIVAYHMSEANKGLLFALLTYLGVFWLAGVAVLIVHIAVLSVAAGMAPWRPLIALKTPLILAFATDNPFVALYSAIEALQEHFGVRREVADTIVPFGVLANQHGQIVLFSVTAVFLAQIYGIELGIVGMLTLGLGIVLSGAAAVGGGAVLASIMAPVLIGAGIPDALAVVILATTQPAVANLASTLTVQATCTLAVLTEKGHARRATEEAARAATEKALPGTQEA